MFRRMSPYAEQLYILLFVRVTQSKTLRIGILLQWEKTFPIFTVGNMYLKLVVSMTVTRGGHVELATKQL